ncbi:fimbrillin family protein [Alistipes sp. OttesenSCG-928-L06]|nr:fimbrillin family protein [Alistipes sp. OttesenSCG-928-L06]
MKKILLTAAISAMALSSCSNDLDVKSTSPENDKLEIGFRGTIDKGNNSRATVTNADNITGFTVTGWWDRESITHLDNVSIPADADLFPGKTTAVETLEAGDYLFNSDDIMRREAGVDDWSYNPLRYWPTKGNGVYFFAYSPASSMNVGYETATPGTYAGGLKNFGGDYLRYEVPDPSETEPQEDFLLARTGRATTSPVTLNFIHALSRIKFFAKTTLPDITYVINGVELVNIRKRGDMDMDLVPTNGELSYPSYNTAINLRWKNQTFGADKDVKVDISEAPAYLTAEYMSLTGVTGGLMVMPQTTAIKANATKSQILKTDSEFDENSFYVKVSYRAFDHPDGFYYAGTKAEPKVIYFRMKDPFHSDSGDVGYSFEPGRQYNIRMVFGSDAGAEIKFAVDVSQWTDYPPLDVPL